MANAHSITDRIRTAAFLLTGVIQLSLQAGPVAAEAVASRQVDRLLEDLGVDGEVPQDLALQCHLISLVSGAVTLRAAETSSPRAGAPDAASVTEAPCTFVYGEVEHSNVEFVPGQALRTLSPERSLGP